MTRGTLFRWAGLASIISGITLAVGEILHPRNDPANVMTSAWAISHQLILVAVILGIAGTFAIYLRQNRETGALGFIGFLLAFIAMTLISGIVLFEAFINPVLAKEAPDFVRRFMAEEVGGTVFAVFIVGGLGFSLGWLLLGWATIRAGIFPKWAAILALVGGTLLGLEALLAQAFGETAAKVPAVLFGLGIIWIGYALWSEKGEMAGAS